MGVLIQDEDFSGLHEVGSRYAWAVVRLDLLDYMRAFPLIGKYNRFLEPLNREAGYMVLHPDFFRSPHPRPAGCVQEYCFAYSVSPWIVMPTIGPQVLIDGRPAEVESARLVPGEAGVYEIRATAPGDARTGLRVNVQLRSSDILSNRAVLVIQ